MLATNTPRLILYALCTAVVMYIERRHGIDYYARSELIDWG